VKNAPMEITPKVEFLGLTFDVTVMIGTLVASLLVLLITIPAARRLALRPSGMQTMMEMVIEFLRGVLQLSFDRKSADKYIAFVVTLFLFIFFANQLGVMMMIPAEAHHPIPEWGLSGEDFEKAKGEAVLFRSPTADMNVTFAMAFAIALFAHIMGIRKHPRQYLAHYFQPFKGFVFLHIIDELAKPTTHAMRLWANIFAGEVLIVIMLKASPLLTGAPLLVWLGYSIFVGTVQAYIFTVLATVYISQKVNIDHH